MDDTDLNCRSLPLEWNGSVNPGQLNEVTMENRLDFTEARKQGMVYSLFHRQSMDQMSPIRGRTMKEYDQQITELKNENFNLKLRIYFLEEKLQQTFTDSSDDLHKLNIDLKIEVENLKKELYVKHELLTKAYAALESMEVAHKAEINDINVKFEKQKNIFHEQINVLQLKSNKSEIEADDTHDEFYQQAFASVISKNSIEEKRLEMEDRLVKLNEELSKSQIRIQELEKTVAVKDSFIKEGEITSVKTQRFIQGIMKTIEEREKELHQLQEKYELQAIELKGIKGEPAAGRSETSEKSQKMINDQQEVIANCLKLLGVVSADVSNYSSSALIHIFKSKLTERQEKMDLMLEEKSKLLKDTENELMQYQEKLQETEIALKIASESIKELGMELRNREQEINVLKFNHGRLELVTSSDKHNEDILGHIKEYIEFLLDDCHETKEMERRSVTIRQSLCRNIVNEQKLGEIEYVIRTNVAKVKLMDNQVQSVQDRLSLLRKLVDRFSMDEKCEVNNSLDIEENMQAIVQGIKIMSNVNNLFCHHIKLNRELSSQKHQNINNYHQTTNGETSLDTIILLRNDYLKIIENLKQQISSAEITIRMLDSKLKNCRQLLRSNVNEAPSPSVNCAQTFENLLECGQTSHVLELKEQMYRLKLLLEQVDSELTPNEVHYEHEMSQTSSYLHSNLREQTLNHCQMGTGSPENVAELQWLRNINNMMQMQLEVVISDIPKGRYASLIQLQQQEISHLRNRCLESFDACKLLRVRLEELVEFMERLLRFDENGLFDTSQFTPQTHELLRRQIAESRTLTRSISHSLLIDAGLSDVSGSFIGPDILEHFGKPNQTYQNSRHEDELSPKSSMDYNCPVSEDLSTLLQNSAANFNALSGTQVANLGTQSEEIASGNDNEYLTLDTFNEPLTSAKYGRQRSSREYDYRDRKYVCRKIFDALSHNDMSDQGLLGCNKAGDLSPSESESWSEPDRDVSQQRIGLKFESHELSPKLKSNCTLSNNRSTSDNSSSAENVQRFWSKSMQIENLQQRLENEIEVNQCLRSELNLCNLLEKDGNNVKHDQKQMSDGNCNTMQRGGKIRVILTDHLLEMRNLRLNMEELFKVNDELRGKLEKRLKTKQRLDHQTDGEVDRLGLAFVELDQQIRHHLSVYNKQTANQVETEELHHQLADLSDKLQLKSSLVQQLEKDVTAREDGCLQLKEANQRLQNNYAHVQRALTDKDGVVEELRAENAQLRVELAAESEKFDAWKIRERELSDELKISKDNCQRFTAQFSEFKVAIARMEEQLEQEHGLRLSMKQKLDEEVAKSSERAKLIKELEEKSEKSNADQMELLKSQIKTLNGFELNMSLLKEKSIGKLGEMNCSVVGLQSKLTELTKALKAKTEKLAKQETCNERSQVMLNERNTTIKKLQEELEKAMTLNEKLHQLSLFTADNLKETRDLNSSLKSKLVLYEQLHLKGQLKNDQSATAHRLPFDINPDKLITEMRCLQTQLELSIQTNNALREQFGNGAVKSGGNATTDNMETGRVKCFNELPTSRLRSNLTIRKCASYPNDRINSMSTEVNLLRQQSKSLSDYVCDDTKQVTCYQLSDKKHPKRDFEPPIEKSISDDLNSHNVYSSPDLGIESDPGLLSSLEKRISNITEEHLRDIHQCEKSSKGSPAEKLSKQNTKFSGNGHLVYAIGYANDYDVLKKDLENNLVILKALQSRVKERLQCVTRTSVKNSEYMTLKEIEKKLNNLTVGLGKSIKLLSSFWKSMLKPPALLEAKNAKLLDENYLLKKKLEQQKLKLHDAMSKLASGSRLKEGMEKAIIKQLTKTHDILKRAKGNLEDQANNPKIKSSLEKV